jgi:hypothetical protein
MKREYTREEFEECVTTLRRHVPNISIATDIICAFPGEGDAEWRDTMDIVRRLRFPVLNISRFYPRRGTPAAGMKQIPTNVAKDRTREITECFNGYETYLGLEGTTHRHVTLVEVAADRHHLVGHTKAFVQVLVDPSTANLGETVDVRITKVTRFSVMGEVIPGSRLLLSAPKQAVNAVVVGVGAATTDGGDVISQPPQQEDVNCPAPRREAALSRQGVLGAAFVAVACAAAMWVVLRHRRSVR